MAARQRARHGQSRQPRLYGGGRADRTSRLHLLRRPSASPLPLPRRPLAHRESCSSTASQLPIAPPLHPCGHQTRALPDRAHSARCQTSPSPSHHSLLPATPALAAPVPPHPHTRTRTRISRLLALQCHALSLPRSAPALRQLLRQPACFHRYGNGRPRLVGSCIVNHECVPPSAASSAPSVLSTAWPPAPCHTPSVPFLLAGLKVESQDAPLSRRASYPLAPSPCHDSPPFQQPAHA